MKKILLFATLILSTFSFGQKKLIGQSNTSYDDNNNAFYIDSIGYNYSSWQGSINEFKPKFGYVGDIMGYFLDEFFVHCDSEDYYSGNSYPLTYSISTNNILTNGLVTEGNQGSTRRLYEYNGLGQQTAVVSQVLGIASWMSFDSVSLTYDGMGNKLTRTRYVIFPNATANETDTFTYAPGTNLLTEAKHYYYNSCTSSFVLSSKSVITYTGNKVNTLGLYYTDVNGNLEYTYKLNYSYSGVYCTGFLAYDVVNNIPTTTVYAKGIFTKNAQNLPSTYSVTVQGDTLGKIAYSYDNDGFLTQMLNYAADDNNQLFLGAKTRYYFQNTASIEEQTDESISIYPNPATSNVTIASEGKLIQVGIYDMKGQLVIEQRTDEIDIHHLESGVYILKGTTEHGTFSQKVVKN